MKRVLVSFLLFSLVILVAVAPVMAAEVYDFYRYDIQFLPDFEYTETFGSEYFVYEGFVPDGKYHVVICYSDTSEVFIDFGVIDVVYEYISMDSVYLFQCDATVTVFGDGVADQVELSLYLASDSELAVFQVSSMGEKVPAEPEVYVSFISVSGDSEKLSVFLDDMNHVLSVFTVSTVIPVFVVGVSLAGSLCICWFGYRFVKSRIRKSFEKGNL